MADSKVRTIDEVLALMWSAADAAMAMAVSEGDDEYARRAELWNQAAAWVEEMREAKPNGPTVDVRVLVRVDRQPDGSLTYNATGQSFAGEADLAENLTDAAWDTGHSTSPAWTWVKATVAAPGGIHEVLGSVDDG